MKRLSPHPREHATPRRRSPPGRRGGDLLRAFSSLRQRNYRLYWFGEMVSLVGLGMQSIGQTWLVLGLTHSAWQLGVVGALQALPVLLFALVGGVLADRWPKRRVLAWVQVAAMAQALLLWALVATGAVQLWHVYLLALALGLTGCLGKPTAQAFVAELVGRTDLPNAVALNSALFNLTRVVGPGLGGVVIAAGGVPALFLLNALSFVASLGGLALMDAHALHAREPRPGDAGARRQTTWQGLREGVAYVCGTPAIAAVILVGGLVLLFGSNFGVVLPVVATEVLHAGAPGFGFLSAAASTGALAATLWLAWSDARPTIRRVLIGALAFGALEALFAASHLYPLSLMLIAGVGGAELAFATLALTLLQTVAPDHLRGRVMGVCTLAFDGSLPLGYLLMGWLAGRYGAPGALLIGALLSVLVAGIGWGWMRRRSAETGEGVADRARY